MTMDQLANPTTIAILLLLVLAFVRFGVWWTVLRTVLRPVLSPVGLVTVGAALAVILQLG